MADSPTVLDRYGMPMRPPARPDTAEVAGIGGGMGGLLQPYIGELSPHPRETHRYRQSMSDDFEVLQHYRRTLADEQVHSTLSQRLDAAIAVDWTVEPGGTKRRDRQAAESLHEQLDALDFNRICRQMLFGVYYGYAVGEALWAVDGARIVLADVRVRAPDRFRWDAEGLMLRTWERPRGEPVGPAKFWVLARPGEHGDVPHGVGLARWCYWPAWMRRNGHRFWATTLERFGSPVPIGKYPRGDMASRAALLDTMRHLSAGSGVAIPEGQDLAMLFSLRSFGTDQDSFSKYMDSMIAKVLLGQSSTTEQGPWRGTAEVQKDVRDEVVASDCGLLDESFTNTIARWLTAWNFPGAAVPKLVRDASSPEDLDARADRETMVAEMSGLRPTRKHVEEVYGGEWEDKPAPPPMPANPDADPDEDPPAAELASPRQADELDVAIDALLADEWEAIVDPVIGPVLAEAEAALERGDTLDALRDRLPAIFAEMDSDRMVLVLRHAAFSATLSGMTADNES